MFAKANYPSEKLSPEELDEYLHEGWFRTAQTIFTCTYISLNHGIYRVHWLRVGLKDLTNDKIFNKLTKLNSRFTLTIQEASITPEKEELYQKYKNGIAFDPSATLEQLLYHGAEINVFNSLEITIYDKEKLIAVGYFDTGKTSAAGISCFYDPDYKKYSLGKYLIYQKMWYCKTQQMDYFYLGYFAPGCKALDYKLDIAKESLEYFDLSSQSWHPINSLDPDIGSLEETKQKLAELQKQLTNVSIENQLFFYSYFQANLFPELEGYDLFDYILFVQCFKFHPELVNPLVVYDIVNREYQLLRCLSLGKPQTAETNPERYSANLLKTSAIVFSTGDAKKMAEFIVEGLEAGLFSEYEGLVP